MTRSLLSLAFVAAFAIACSDDSAKAPGLAPAADGTEKVSTGEKSKGDKKNGEVKKDDKTGDEDKGTTEDGDKTGEEDGGEGKDGEGKDGEGETDVVKMDFAADFLATWSFVEKFCPTAPELLPAALRLENDNARAGAKTHAYVFAANAEENARITYTRTESGSVSKSISRAKVEVSGITNAEKSAEAKVIVRRQKGFGDYNIEEIYSAKLVASDKVSLELTRVDSGSGCPGGVVTAVYEKAAADAGAL